MLHMIGGQFYLHTSSVFELFSSVMNICIENTCIKNTCIENTCIEKGI